MSKVTTLVELEEVYGSVAERSLWKEIDYLSPQYQKFIEASPFLILATFGEKGIDCSPRGDPAGFVRVVDERTLLIPDRKGNNRLDSLKNIVLNGEVGLIFLVPNAGEAIRVAGKGEILIDEKLCNSFSINKKPASSILRVKVKKAYFQCQKAIARSSLWDSSTYEDRSKLPSAGVMSKYFTDLHNIEFNWKSYDENYAEHMKKTIY
jgi:PPOX class probable FMN-dependent enzyme